MSTHARFSASKIEQLMACPGSHVLQDGLPDRASVYSAEGTAAHQVLAWALEQNVTASAFIGRVIHVDKAGSVVDRANAEYEFEVDDDMAEHVQSTLDTVARYAGPDDVVLSEVLVDYSEFVGAEPGDGAGTADVIILHADGETITVLDLKYGRGLAVSAEQNPQMSCYALGAIAGYRDVADFKRVRMIISQPRITSEPSVYECTVEELVKWAQDVARPAIMSARNARATYVDRGASHDEWLEVFTRAGEDQCRFCKAKATCPTLRAEVAVTVSAGACTADEFDSAEFDEIVVVPKLGDADTLASCLAKVDLIEGWCIAIRAEAERRLLAAEDVPGFKLVPGRKGARKWADKAEAEETLKSMRLKEAEMYDFKLISPTTAEKLYKAKVIGPRQWPKLQGLITQPDGKLHVAPLDDPRQAVIVTSVVEDFPVDTSSEFA